MQFQHDQALIILNRNHRLLIFGTQGALDLLGFFPEIKKLFISQILDLDIEGRFISRGKTSGIKYSLSAYGAGKIPGVS